MKTLAATAAFSIILLAACGTGGGGAFKNEAMPEVQVQFYQHTVYNGKPQPIKFSYAGDEASLVVSYFDSIKAIERGETGKTAAPVEGGRYFVLIKQPEDSGHAARTVPVVEYLIEQAEMRISAEARQEAVYDGNPKRVRATADAPVPLSYSYFPSVEAMRAVIGSAETPQERREAVPKGFTRVEHPPVEPGTYYVLVYYSGDRNYRSTAKEIEFVIKPRY